MNKVNLGVRQARLNAKELEIKEKLLNFERV